MTKDNTVAQKIEQFFAVYPERHFGRGELLIRAGETPLAMYIVSGNVVQYDISEAGDKLVVNVYKPGAFLPLACILNAIPSEFFFEAEDMLVARVAPASDVLAFLHHNADVAVDALARMSRGTVGLMRRLASVMQNDAEARIIAELRIASARFADAHGYVAMTESELASRVGLARETVSRALTRLKNRGQISRQRGKIRFDD